MYNEKPRTDFLPLIFIGLEVIFAITIISILSNLLSTNNITTEFADQPTASIANLRSAIPEFPSEMVATIERQLYTALLDNSSKNSIQNSDTKASIVTDSVIRNNFDTRGVHLVSAAIDVPALRQSYSFFYGYPEEGNDDFQTFYTVLCPVSSSVGSYADFDCDNSFEGDVTKETILSSFLPYYDFAYFSPYVDPTNPKRIIIGPSITYNNDQKTKDGYIKEVREAIDTLGMDSNDYEYYVRTAADINYENTDR